MKRVLFRSTDVLLGLGDISFLREIWVDSFASEVLERIEEDYEEYFKEEFEEDFSSTIQKLRGFGSMFVEKWNIHVSKLHASKREKYMIKNNGEFADDSKRMRDGSSDSGEEVRRKRVRTQLMRRSVLNGQTLFSSLRF